MFRSAILWVMFFDTRIQLQLNVSSLLHNIKYKVCPKSHEIYFFAALLLVAACSNRLGEVGGTLIFIAHQRSVCCENQTNRDS